MNGHALRSHLLCATPTLLGCYVILRSFSSSSNMKLPTSDYHRRFLVSPTPKTHQKLPKTRNLKPSGNKETI